MAASGRRTVWIIAVPLLLVLGLLLACGWGVGKFFGGVGSFFGGLSSGSGPTPMKYDTPTELARASVPHRPHALAWSPDGTYVAGGALGSDGEKARPCEFYVVDAARGSVAKTLEAVGVFPELAFSPDGKWLAVYTRQSVSPGPEPSELLVVDVPGFSTRLKVKASKPKNSWLGLAWAPDSKALCAIDGQDDLGQKAEVRRWAVPDFSEKNSIGDPQTARYASLAVSPDGLTLAVAEKPPGNRPQRIRLFDLASGGERSSFEAGTAGIWAARLGFTPDGKALGVKNDRGQVSWWDVNTGKPAEPDPANFVVEPPGPRLVTPDGDKTAQGDSRYARLVGESWGKPENLYGAFVVIEDTKKQKTWTWRLGGTTGADDAPTLSFSPDGKKLAGGFTEYDDLHRSKGDWLAIWKVPE